MKTIKINDLSQLATALALKSGEMMPCVECDMPLDVSPDLDEAPICNKCYAELCKTCGGAGSYYEDVAGDGGSRMEIPCDDCFVE